MAIAERWGWGFRGAYTGGCTYERETRDNDELDKGDSTNTVSGLSCKRKFTAVTIQGFGRFCG